MAHGIVSADSHVMEPANLWTERLDTALRDRAPSVIENPEEGPKFLFVAEGAPPFPVAGGFAAGASGKELKDLMDKGYEAARPSGWDPVERIKDQEVDGVDAEILYPTLGMSCFGIPDGALQRACFAAYNGWLAEYTSHDPRRLYGIGLVSLEDVKSACEDIEAIAKQGMRGAMIWGAPPEDRPYNDIRYDAFWQAASDLRLPVSLHIIASRGRQSSSLGNVTQPQQLGRANMAAGIWYMTVIHEIQQSIAQLVFGGVLERFPDLRIVSAENDTGWLPHFLYRADHAYEKYKGMQPDPLPHPPSFYLERQVWATFQDDPVGPHTHEIFGADNYMWASDFPHSDSTFPDSHQWIEKNFENVPADVRRKIVYENAVKLYGMDL
jgi:predicted TIM-barrel fold metal-dependent hydrolase